MDRIRTIMIMGLLILSGIAVYFSLPLRNADLRRSVIGLIIWAVMIKPC